MESSSGIELEGRRRDLCGKRFHSGGYFHDFLLWGFLKRFSQETNHFVKGVISQLSGGQKGTGVLWKGPSCILVDAESMYVLDSSEGSCKMSFQHLLRASI